MPKQSYLQFIMEAGMLERLEMSTKAIDSKMQINSDTELIWGIDCNNTKLDISGQDNRYTLTQLTTMAINYCNKYINDQDYKIQISKENI